MKVCENVIIHRNDGKEILCEDQSDLNLYMRKGLCFKPPLTYADMSRYWSSVYPKEQLPKIHDPLGDLEHGYKPFSCLCPVDLRQTAVLNGFRYSKEFPDGEYDPFDIHFYLSQNDNGGDL